MSEISVTIRFPRDLHAAIKKRAQESKRLFNSEVIYKLRQYQETPMLTGSQAESQRHITEEDLQGTETAMEEVWKRYVTR